jgi:hypothetical protein
MEELGIEIRRHCNGVPLGMYDLRSKGKDLYTTKQLHDFNSIDRSIDYHVV